MSRKFRQPRRRRRRLRGKYRRDRENRRAASSAWAKRVAETIVGRALVGVHQDIVGFAEFLEFFFGVRVVRIFIGMKFDRELAIGAFDLLLGGSSLDAQDLVVIAFGSVADDDTISAEYEILWDYGNANIKEPILCCGRSKRPLSKAAGAGPSIDNRGAAWRTTTPSATSSLGSCAIASCRLGSNFFPSAVDRLQAVVSQEIVELFQDHAIPE